MPEHVEAGRRATRSGAEQHHPPRPVGCLDQVGVTRVLYRPGGAAVAEDRVGAGSSPTGPSARALRAIDTAWPRSVPPSARRRYQTPSRSKRCGASGYCSPVPDQVGVGPSSTAPVSVVDSASLESTAGRVVDPANSRRVPRRGPGRCPDGDRTGSDHGPAGSSPVTKSWRQAPCVREDRRDHPEPPVVVAQRGSEDAEGRPTRRCRRARGATAGRGRCRSASSRRGSSSGRSGRRGSR